MRIIDLFSPPPPTISVMTSSTLPIGTSQIVGNARNDKCLRVLAVPCPGENTYIRISIPAPTSHHIASHQTEYVLHTWREQVTWQAAPSQKSAYEKVQWVRPDSGYVQDAACAARVQRGTPAGSPCLSSCVTVNNLPIAAYEGGPRGSLYAL